LASCQFVVFNGSRYRVPLTTSSIQYHLPLFEQAHLRFNLPSLFLLSVVS
jgi:hypothetical protein